MAHDGWTAKQLALQIKRLYFDSQSDYIVLDTGGEITPLVIEI